MEDMSLPAYTIAEGPEGLAHELENLLEKCQQDTDFAGQEHYVLYQLRDQKSLIKIDMSQKPYLFWYYDLLGRPMTRIVKETIARFLWEKCGEKERFLQEYGDI
jgi:hypothetical protein